MKIHHSLDEATRSGKCRRGIALGIFDGVHRGHRKIINSLLKAQRKESLDSSLILTFDPHPLALVRPEAAPSLILTIDERLAELERRGVSETLVLPFTPELARTSYESFTREILIDTLGLGHLAAGYDFHLGSGRRGSAEGMAALGEELGFRVNVVSPCYLNGHIVSSTRIRQDLAAGDLPQVAAALNRPWRISGEVIAGRGLGRKLTFPTANIAPPPAEKQLPPPGVYLVQAYCGKKTHHGLLNLGWAPTLKNEFSAEVHLLDFAGDLYGDLLEVDVLQWLRPEETFPDAAALSSRIREDIARAREILAAGPDFAK
ncbi:MAG: riboflavin biosynthesis protein RibF [bacterium]|nr:riboflavin biosynthesis protein RibF [bacterium]